MKYRILVSAWVLAASSVACAGDSAFLSIGQKADRHKWQMYDERMTPGQYRDAYRHNQDLVLDYMESYSKNTLRSVGIPKAGINLMGTAAGLAAGRDAKIYLNKSKLLALEVKDAVDSDRSLMLGIKVKW